MAVGGGEGISMSGNMPGKRNIMMVINELLPKQPEVMEGTHTLSMSERGVQAATTKEDVMIVEVAEFMHARHFASLVRSKTRIIWLWLFYLFPDP